MRPIAEKQIEKAGVRLVKVVEVSMNTIEQFFDHDGISFHDRFQAWRTNNQDGVFLTLEARNRANLHRARCRH